MPLDSQAYPTMNQSGREAARVSRSRSEILQMAERKAKMIIAMLGRNFYASSESNRLQLSLESRFQAQLNGDGGTKQRQTLKIVHTPLRRRLFQLTALAQTMKESGYGGLPTPNARDGKDISTTTAYLAARNRHTPSVATHLLKLGKPWKVIASIYCLLMGYPYRWQEIALKALAMPLSRKSQPRSSKLPTKQ